MIDVTTQSHTRSLAFSLALISCCASVVFVARAYNNAREERATPTAPNPTRPAVSPKASGNTTASSATQGGPPALRGPVQVVRFALYDVVIYPREAHARQGIVALSFEDLSGGGSEMVIERETGAAPISIGRVLRIDHSPRGRNDLVLLPGRYRVYATDHPQDLATLIVDP